MRGDCRAARAAARRFLRRLATSGLSVLTSLGLADRANAEYLQPDFPRAPAYAQCQKASQDLHCETWYAYTDAGDYIDRMWYNLLDDGQYRYLDKGQYNLMGEAGYLLGHPCYPKLFERDSEQAVGFTNKVNTGWFSSGGGRVAIVEYAVLCSRLNAGDYIDRLRYYHLDKGQYYYLDKGQYNLMGGLGYLFGRPSYPTRYGWDSQLEKSGRFPAPEPSTIGFLGLGSLIALGCRICRNGRRY